MCNKILVKNIFLKFSILILGVITANLEACSAASNGSAGTAGLSELDCGGPVMLAKPVARRPRGGSFHVSGASSVEASAASASFAGFDFSSLPASARRDDLGDLDDEDRCRASESLAGGVGSATISYLKARLAAEVAELRKLRAEKKLWDRERKILILKHYPAFNLDQIDVVVLSLNNSALASELNQLRSEAAGLRERLAEATSVEVASAVASPKSATRDIGVSTDLTVSGVTALLMVAAKPKTLTVRTRATFGAVKLGGSMAAVVPELKSEDRSGSPMPAGAILRARRTSREAVASLSSDDAK